MYTPYTDNNNMEVNGNVSEARTTALCTATASLITSINALSPANPAAGEVAVLSATHNARHDVVQVIVDSKLDSQRRRERSLRPLYVEHHAV